jgi:hypothetical protein
MRMEALTERAGTVGEPHVAGEVLEEGDLIATVVDGHESSSP